MEKKKSVVKDKPEAKKKRPPKSVRKHARKKKAEVAQETAPVVDKAVVITCKFCGETIFDPEYISGRKCAACVVVERNLPEYLKSIGGLEYVKQQLREATRAVAPKDVREAETKLAKAQSITEHLKGQLREKNERLRELEKQNKEHKNWKRDIRIKTNALHNAIHANQK